MKISDKNKINILLTGGGSGGSVSPLLAIADELGQDKYEYLWLGTYKGPEQAMVKKEKIKFKKIAAGKLRRYFSLKTALTPFFVFIGLIQSFFIIVKFRPRWIICAGGFVCVPVIWAGWLLRRKIIIHQQDIRPGLANILMAPFAKTITVTFPESLNDYGKKARWIGNPVRTKKLAEKNKNTYNLKADLPTVLILGGGTGASFINELVANSLTELTKICQIIHVTGQDRMSKNTPIGISNYYSYIFLNIDKMAEAYRRSDIIVSRCGLATLSELAFFGKPTILIPMPDTHQVDNAEIFQTASAAIVLDELTLEKTFFINKVKELLNDKEQQKLLVKNIKEVIKTDAAKEIAQIIK